MSRLPRWIGLLSVVSLIVGAQASTATARKPPPAQPGEEAAVEAIRKVGRGGAHASGRIEWVSFGETDVDDPTTANFRGLTNLEKVDFILAKITDATPANLAGCTNLTQVEFVATPITDVGVAHLASLKKLEYLGLAGTRVTDAGLARLGKLPQLRQLVLDRTAVTDEGLRQLTNFPSLTVLSLNNVRKEHNHADVPTVVLTGELAGGSRGRHDVYHPDPKREVFAVAGPIITDAGLETLAPLENLESLDLSGTKITGAGLRYVSQLKNLSTLKINDTAVGDAGLEYLVKLESLRSLHLDDTEITDAALLQIAKLSTLDRLSLNGTKITDAELHHLAKLTRLVYLDLDDTAITDAGLAELAKLATLKQLSLKRTKITSAGLVHLYGRKDFVLWAAGTQVGPKGVAEWNAAHKGRSRRVFDPRSTVHCDFDESKFQSGGGPKVGDDSERRRQEKEDRELLLRFSSGKPEDTAAFLAALENRPELLETRQYARKMRISPDPESKLVFGPTALHIAAYHDDLATARLLLRRGASARATERHGSSPAAYCASVSMLELLIEHDAIIEPKEPPQRPILFDARNAEVAEAMMRHGADPHRRDAAGNSALHLAIANRRADVVQLLIDRGVDLNHADSMGRTPLHEAIFYGEVELARMLIARGADIRCLDDNGASPLHLAADEGKLELVKLLLERGCDVNDCRLPEKSESDESNDWYEIAEQIAVLPLAVAQYYDHPESWQEVAEFCGSILDALEAMQLNRAVPPLAYAVRGNKFETAKYLVAHGAKYDFGDQYLSGKIFLSAMYSEASPETVRFILDHGGKRHCKRRLGPILLIAAIENRLDIEIVRMLLDAGAPIDGRIPDDIDDDGTTTNDPLVPTVATPRKDPLADDDGFMISWSGGQPDGLDADTRGWTPLHFAARRGYEEAAQLLMERGADVHARSHNGETPLDLAVPFEQPRPGVDDEFPDEYETGRVVRNKARTAIGELLKTVQAKTPAATLRR